MDKQNFDFDIFKAVAEEFMELLTKKLEEAGIPAGSFLCDHLCFRVATFNEYEFYRTALSRHGTLLTEAMVNGRAISTFRLKTPFRTSLHEIPLLELPAPKQGTSYSTGFEHAEFVIDESFTTFRSQFPHLNFLESGHKGLNPELCLKLGEGMQAKFHHLSLDRVIELEEAEAKKTDF